MDNIDNLLSTTPSWKKKLQALARVHGMCGDNRAYLNACDSKADAIKLYKQTIDWALERDYPGLDVLRKDFCDCEGDGLFIDKTFNGETLTEHQVYVFHHCNGVIRVGLNLKKKIIPMLYFANDCNMTVEGLGVENMFADRVPLYIFGDNNIIAHNTPQIVFKRYNHGRVDK